MWPIEQAGPKTRYEMRRNYMKHGSGGTLALALARHQEQLYFPTAHGGLDDGGRAQSRQTRKMQYIVDNCPLLALRTMSAWG